MRAPTYVSATTGAVIIDCIANNGADGKPEVPLWHCPCAECTRMDWEACDDETKSYYSSIRIRRHAGFPEYWDATGYARHKFNN